MQRPKRCDVRFSWQVSITDATPGATVYYTTVYYTTDGKTPSQSSTPYTGPIAISASTTLMAVAGYLNSSVAAARYTIQ